MGSNSLTVVCQAAEPVTTIATQVVGALVTGCSVLLVAYIAYRSGLKAYFREREHERITKRYLDDGIDCVSASVDQVLRVFNDNCLRVDTVLLWHERKEDEKGKLSIEFERFERGHLELTAYLKLTDLVGERIYWPIIQMLFGFVDGHITVLNGIMDDKKMSESEMVKMVQACNEDYSQKFNKYKVLVKELRVITVGLEQ